MIDEITIRMASEIESLRTRLQRLEAQEVARSSVNPTINSLAKRNVTGLLRSYDFFLNALTGSTITVPDTSWTVIPWASTRYNTYNAMWNSSTPTRIICPLDGWVDFSAVIQIPATTGTIGAYFRANGATQVHEEVHGAGTLGSTLSPNFSYPVRTGDYFELFILQTTGSSKNITVTSYVSPEVRAIYRPTSINPTPGTQKYIMAVGDSKTVGGAGGYRTKLQDVILAANKNVGWVGAIDGIANGTSLAGMQGFHSAVSGATTSTIRTLVANAAINQAPDVILMWLGTNDLRAATSEATIEAAYNGFLDDIFARWPSVTVCCANIDQNYESGTPPLFNPATFNAFIAGLPAARGSQVKAVDMYTPLNYASLHTDNLHPNYPEGEWVVAMTWWNTIKALV